MFKISKKGHQSQPPLKLLSNHGLSPRITFSHQVNPRRISSSTRSTLLQCRPIDRITSSGCLEELEPGPGHHWIWGFPARHGGTPKGMVFVRENPIKMDDLGGTPISGNHHIIAYHLGNLDFAQQKQDETRIFTCYGQKLFFFGIIPRFPRLGVGLQSIEYEYWNFMCPLKEHR